jgi:hypothetical protein
MEPASSLPIQEVRPCGLRLASMSPGIGSGGPLNTRGRQTDSGTALHTLGPPPSNFSARRHCQSMDDQGTSGQRSGFIGRESLDMSQSSEDSQSGHIFARIWRIWNMEEWRTSPLLQGDSRQSLFFPAQLHRHRHSQRRSGALH